MKKAIIIGAGVMGLSAGYYLLKNGVEADIYEAEASIGGMAAHFDFDDISIEKFYHFICKPDKSLFLILKELGILDKLKWTPTKMGYFYDGKLYKWGTPPALISFPKLDLFSKIRYGLHAMYATKIANFSKLDKKNAVEWIKKWIGNSAYKVLWQKLFELKFFKYTDNLSAAWIASRIRRVGLSRKNIMQEGLGYIEGGSSALIEALEKNINAMGGKIYTNSQVDEINVENLNEVFINVNNTTARADFIISTIPLPIVANILKGAPRQIIDKYKKVTNIPVVCAVCKLKQKITENFWLNINDDSISIPGIIEYTNLNVLNGNDH
ncbi:FAD-dependent oxidoreductase, partial [Desulfurella sp.]|uniref:FAD-dependent oxidoreductase n=1 Tax=Desulfurella sp. TaxID=1962857 RepID=UPI0025C1992C